MKPGNQLEGIKGRPRSSWAERRSWEHSHTERWVQRRTYSWWKVWECEGPISGFPFPRRYLIIIIVLSVVPEHRAESRSMWDCLLEITRTMTSSTVAWWCQYSAITCWVGIVPCVCSGPSLGRCWIAQSQESSIKTTRHVHPFRVYCGATEKNPWSLRMRFIF